MRFTVNTKGHNDIIDVTSQIAQIIKNSNIQEGAVLIFVPGSTASITAIEYESGVIKDLQRILEKIAPENDDYEHHKRWGDHNGAAHIKSALLGADFMVPIENGQLSLGTWQQIVLIDFDERPRQREVIVKILSEK